MFNLGELQWFNLKRFSSSPSTCRTVEVGFHCCSISVSRANQQSWYNHLLLTLSMQDSKRLNAAQTVLMLPLALNHDRVSLCSPSFQCEAEHYFILQLCAAYPKSRTLICILGYFSYEIYLFLSAKTSVSSFSLSAFSQSPFRLHFLPTFSELPNTEIFSFSFQFDGFQSILRQCFEMRPVLPHKKVLIWQIFEPSISFRQSFLHR